VIQHPDPPLWDWSGQALVVGCGGIGSALADALRQVELIFLSAEEKAKDAARKAAEIVDHPSDLAILFLANTWSVNKIAEVNDVVRRVVNYHHGLPYWRETEHVVERRQDVAH